ncbi:MAG: glycosyltransferase family 2 protein [Lentisphaerota bacterium]
MSQTAGKKVTVVVPFLNEEENLPLLYDRLVKALEAQPEELELILVDDGSTDGSPRWAAEKARADKRVKLIRLSRNFGHQIAITAGLDCARGDAVVIIDADLQDPPEVIPSLLAKWREGFEVVYAVRSSREGETWLKKFLAASFYRMFRSMSNVQVPMDAGDFRLVDRKVADALKNVRELHRFMRGLTCWVGFNQVAVTYERAARHAGQTKYPVLKSLRLALDAVTSFSGAPLRWVTGMGLAIALAGVLMLISVIVNRYLHPQEYVAGWATLISLILFIGGIQLVCIGMLGQYISRIFEESKKRPLYFIKETVGE